MAETRGRIGWIASGVAVLVLATILILQKSEPQATAAPKVATARASVLTENRVSSPRKAPRPVHQLPGLPAAETSPHPPGSTAEQEWIEQRADALEELTWFDDAASLEKILAELANPLPEIRAAALEAVRDFGSSDAIPHLEELSNQSVDSLERQNLAELITFLKTPTLLEMADGSGAD